MSWLDYAIFGFYMAAILGVGWYHFRRNRSEEDYYVGGRNVPPLAVGLSVVATDVGGGFSIGLGGVGFLMGLSGTWLLFTGLVGAWLSAVFVIPRLKAIKESNSMLTYPDFLRHRYNGRVALVAAVLSGGGYLLFTGGQILAGARLAADTAITQAPFGWDPFTFALYVMGFIIIAYTVLGGIKAVIYTDFIQWIVLMFGLVGLAIPLALHRVGGWSALRAALPPEFFSLHNIDRTTFINWMVTIIPIWLVGMTLYQRMFACRGAREARRAWFIAGFFEYPVMAFMGVILGMCARVLFPELGPDDAERGLPMLIKDVLPVGITGMVVAAYFSAIMSTADSTLMASSGNLVTDLVQRFRRHPLEGKALMRLSQLATLGLGILALLFAAQFQTVLGAILYAYGFLVSGLFFPTLGAFFWPRGSSAGALAGMLAGGGLTVALQLLPFGLGGYDPTVFGLALSAVVYVAGSLLWPDAERARAEGRAA